MNYTISEIEDAVLTALAPMSVANGGPLRTLGSYEGQFEEALTGRDQTIVLLPAALVTFTGATYLPDDEPCFERTVRFAVLHASMNLKSEPARRREVYTLLETSKRLLLNQTLGLEITPLVLERETVVESSRSVTVYGAEYSLSYQEDLSAY
ncbi:MAG: DUF1834 family protein [Nitrospinae bacterium]|nr:DUF1834 family protein [Nitrospinota bacterium]